MEIEYSPPNTVLESSSSKDYSKMSEEELDNELEVLEKEIARTEDPNENTFRELQAFLKAKYHKSGKAHKGKMLKEILIALRPTLENKPGFDE